MANKQLWRLGLKLAEPKPPSHPATPYHRGCLGRQAEQAVVCLEGARPPALQRVLCGQVRVEALQHAAHAAVLGVEPLQLVLRYLQSG